MLGARRTAEPSGRVPKWRGGVGACIAALLCIACEGMGPSSADSLESEARLSAANHEYERALMLYDSARHADPGRTSASAGYARQAAVLHQYDRAIPAFEEALAADPTDPGLWQDYATTLFYGGAFWGDNRWHARAADRAAEALLHEPSVTTLQMLERSMARAGAYEQWAGALAERASLGEADGPLLHALQQARVAAAVAADDPEEANRQREALRTLLDGLATEIAAQRSPPDADAYYRLAAGYDFLRDREAAAEWLERAETEFGSGHDFFQTLSWFARLRRASLAGSASEKLATIDELVELAGSEALTARGAEWAVEEVNVAAAASRLRFEALAELATPDPGDGAWRGIPATELEPPQPSTNDELANRILAASIAADRFETSGREWVRWRLAEAMLYMGAHQRLALDLVDEAIAGIEADGMRWFDAFEIREHTREEARLRRLSRLYTVRARAHAQLGRPDEAEAASRTAVETRRSAYTLAHRGRLQLARGEPGPALVAFVDALAFGFGGSDQAVANTTTLAEAAAARLGHSAGHVAAALALRQPEIDAEIEARVIGRRIDEPAPDFALLDRTGETWRMSDLRGQRVVITYWATWCGPCVEEFPHYQRFVRAFDGGEDVVFLAVSIDTDRVAAEAFLDEHGYSFRVLFDPTAGSDFDVSGIPQTLFVDAEGQLQFRMVGFRADRYVEDMRLRIEALATRD